MNMEQNPFATQLLVLCPGVACRGTGGRDWAPSRRSPGTRQRHFAGTSLKPRKLPENAHAVLKDGTLRSHYASPAYPAPAARCRGCRGSGARRRSCAAGVCWAVFSLSKTRRSNPWAAKPIFVQFAIIFGVYARLETLYTHMTFARFARGLAALHH